MTLQTTDDKTFHYGPKRWDWVRQSLKVIKINADTATVGKEQRPLRSELERLARQCWECWENKSSRPPTVAQVVNTTTNDIKKIATVRDLFGYEKLTDHGRVVRSFVPVLLDDKRAAEVHQLLTAVVLELEAEVKRVHHGSEIDMFRYEGRQGNASKPALRNYMKRLAAVWDELAGASTAPRHRNRFVAACVLVDVISIKNVRDFLSNKKTKTKVF
jgi:hypothetical protein